MLRTAPPFRADHVGSLLRPPELKEARLKRERGEINAEQLKSVEDRCIREVIAKQESVGLRGVTDGEFRREFWHLDFLWVRPQAVVGACANLENSGRVTFS